MEIIKGLLTLEEIQFVADLKIYEKDEVFITEVMEKFKSMGRVENLKNITLNFMSTVTSYIKTNFKEECKYVGLSPMRETFKILVSDVDNLGIYFGVGEVPYIEKINGDDEIMERYFVEDISYSTIENHYRIVIESSGNVLFDIDCLDYNDLVVEMNKEGYIKIRHNTFIRNNTILNEDDIKFVTELELNEYDEIFILEIMEKFKSMGIVIRLYSLTNAFISVIKIHIKTKFKKECKEKLLSPMKETFKMLNRENFKGYFNIGDIIYVEKLIKGENNDN